MAKKETNKERILRAQRERKQSAPAYEINKRAAERPKKGKPSDVLEKKVKIAKAVPAIIPAAADVLPEAIEERVYRIVLDNQDELSQLAPDVQPRFVALRYEEEYGQQLADQDPDLRRTSEIMAKAGGGEKVAAPLSPQEEATAAKASRKPHKATARQGLQDLAAEEADAVTAEKALRTRKGVGPTVPMTAPAVMPEPPVTIPDDAVAWANVGSGENLKGTPLTDVERATLPGKMQLRRARRMARGSIPAGQMGAEAAAGLAAVRELLTDKPPVTQVPPLFTPSVVSRSDPSPNFAPPIEPEISPMERRLFGRSMAGGPSAPPQNTGGTVPSPKPKGGKWFSKGEKVLGGLGLATMFLPSMVEGLKSLTGRDEEEYWRQRSREAKLALTQYSSELRQADIQDRLDALVERRQALLQQNDPGLAQIIAGMRELNPDEGVIGGKPPSQERVKNFVLGEAIASGAAQQAMGE